MKGKFIGWSLSWPGHLMILGNLEVSPNIVPDYCQTSAVVFVRPIEASC